MPNDYFQNYIPVLMMAGVVGVFAVALLLVSSWIGPHRPSRMKLAAYECGMTPTGDARQRFSVKFYLVAMIFILFDVEAVFLYPWAVIFRELKMFGFVEMFLFLMLMLAGFAYLWKRGVFDWTRPETGELE